MPRANQVEIIGVAHAPVFVACPDNFLDPMDHHAFADGPTLMRTNIQYGS